MVATCGGPQRWRWVLLDLEIRVALQIVILIELVPIKMMTIGCYFIGGGDLGGLGQEVAELPFSG